MNHKKFTNLRKVLEDKGVSFDIPIMSAIDRDIEQNIKGLRDVKESQKEVNKSNTVNSNEPFSKSVADKFRSKRII